MADYNFLAKGIGSALQEGGSAGYYVAHGRQLNEENEGRKEAAPYIAAALTGDKDAIGKVAQASPSLLQHVYPAIARMDAAKQQHLLKVANWAGDAAGAILDAPEGQRAAMYDVARKAAEAQGIPTQNWPATYDQGTANWLQIHRAHAIGAKDYFKDTHAKPKAGGGGGGAGPDLEPMAGLPSASPAGTAVADASPVPVNALAQAGEPVAAPDAPIVAQAAPPPGPAGPPMIAEAPPMPLGGAAPPNAGGIGGGEPPEAPPVQMAQAGPAPAIGPAMAPPAAALEKPAAPAGGPQQPQGVIWPTDPSLQGGVMMGHRAKPGQPLMPAEVGGHFIYKLPDGKTVLYKPKAAVQDEEKYVDVFGPDGKTLIGQRNGKTNQFHPVNSPGLEAVDPSLTGDDVYAALPPARGNEIKAIVEGRQPLPSPNARTPYAQETRKLVFQAGGADFSDTLHASRMDMTKKLNGKLGDALTTQGTIYSHLQELQDAGEELKNTPYPILNKVGNWVGLNTGDPRVTNMMQVKRRVNEELEKYFGGTGGTTVSGLAEAQNDLNLAQAPDQLEGAIGKINHLISGRQNEVINQVNRGMGYKGDKQLKPEDLLSKEAIAARDYVQGRLRAKEKPAAAADAPTAPGVRRYNPDTGKIE